MSVTGSRVTKTAQLTVPSKPQYLASIRQLILDFIQETSLHKEGIQDFILAATEAATNSIRHSRSKYLTVILGIDKTSLMVKVIDKGRGFKFYPSMHHFPDAEAKGGRGIPLMSSLVDHFEVDSHPDRGTEVTLIKRLRKKTPKTASLQ